MAALMAAMAPSATAVATCRTCLTRMSPGGVDAGNGGFHLFVGGDVAVFQSQLSEQLRVGNHAGIHEDAAARVLHGLNMSIMLAGDLQPLYLVLAVHGVEPGGQPELDVSGSCHLLTELRNAAQLVFEVDNGQLLGEGGQVQRLFHGTVRSAHYIDVLSGVSGAVPGSVHAHALARQLRLAGDTQLPGACRRLPG